MTAGILVVIVMVSGIPETVSWPDWVIVREMTDILLHQIEIELRIFLNQFLFQHMPICFEGGSSKRVGYFPINNLIFSTIDLNKLLRIIEQLNFWAGSLANCIFGYSRLSITKKKQIEILGTTIFKSLNKMLFRGVLHLVSYHYTSLLMISLACSFKF